MTATSATAQHTPIEASAPQQERPRFRGFRFERLANGRCSAEVELTWGGGYSVRGTAVGLSSPSGDLRCAAEACIAALGRSIAGVRFELRGVKAIRAFDASVVVVSVQPAHGRRLVGTALGRKAGTDVTRAAALAVLQAVNRIVTRRSSS